MRDILCLLIICDLCMVTAATTRLGKNVCYIAGGLAVREDKILLIQEGMPSCRGTWYLPCGRVDPNETIEVRYYVTLTA